MRRLSRRMTIVAASAAFAIGIPFGIVIAGAGFADVPPSNPFYNDINALADSGVTGGCGGGNFCPKDNVTREQMAAFMNRLGALSPSKTPVVNADKVDGYQANALARSSFKQLSGSLTLTAGFQTIVTTSLSVPGPGYVIVNATVTPYSFDAGCGCESAFSVTDGTTTSFSQRAQVGAAAGAARIANVAPQYVFTYTAAGNKTFTLQGLNFQPGSGDVNVQYSAISALYVPFGTGGAAPAAAPPAADGAAAPTE